MSSRNAIMSGAPARSVVNRFNQKSRNLSKLAPVYVVRHCDAGRQPVYNITVADTHEYFANDMLVHNCWGMTELLVDLLTFGVSVVGENEIAEMAEQRVHETTGQLIDSGILSEINRGGLYFPG